MKGKKNLERAVVLGLLLSTSIYGSALAAGVSIDDFVDGKTGIITIDTDTETVVNGNGTQGGDSDTAGNSLFSNVNGTRYNNKVFVSNGLGLTFNNVALNNAYIQSNGKLTINNIAYGMKAGLYLDANITAAELEINATGKGAKGIHAYNDNRNEVNSGDILINVANGVRITSDSDGIFTEADISGEVDPTNSIDINAGSLEVVTYSRGGIYNNGVNDVENHIRINVGEGLVSVTSGDDTGRYGGIINKNVGDTTIDAGTIMVTAKESNGVLSTNGTINLNAGHNNIINGGTNAVYNNGTGTINIRAEKKDGDISTLADYNDYDNVLIAGENGVKSDSTGTTNVIADNNNYIAGTTNGILSDGAGTITVTAGNDNIIGQYSYQDESGTIHTVTSQTGINVTGDNGTINITSTNRKTDIYGKNGISVDGKGNKLDVTAGTDITIDSSNRGIYVYNSNNINNPKNIIKLNSENGTNEVVVNAKTGLGIYAAYNSEITLTAKNNEVTLNGNGSAIQSTGSGSKISLNASEVNTIQANGELGTGSWGVYADNDGQVYLDAGFNKISGAEAGILSQNLYNGINSYVEVKATGNNEISSEQVAVHARNAGLVNIQAEDSNIINSEIYGLVSDVHDFGVNKEVAGEINLSANVNNIIKAGVISSNIEKDNFADGLAIVSENGGTINVEAGNENTVFGAVYAGGKAETKVSEVTLSGGKNEDGTLKGSINNVYSAAVIDGAGGLDGKVTTTDPETEESVTTGLDVVSALYAEKGAVINVSGTNDFRTYYSNPLDSYTSERVVWAYDTADINIDGYTNISTTLYNESPNSKDIAIAAGTATNLTAGEVNASVEDRATVTLTYDNFTTNDGKQAVSEITGDILSAYAGKVDIAGKSADAGIKITGNLLAGNNGILNVNLGKGGVLTGRADDYGDAGANESGVGSGNDGHQSSEFFDPAFSSEIFKGGEVNLTMGENSRWNVTGQSWITRIKTAENSNAIIDLVGSNTDRNTTAHALTVYEMNGDANFNMNLDADRDVSDMLYIKNAKGNYVVNVIDAVTEDDMYAARTDGGTFDGLRFATVGKDSTASFRAITYDGGFNNVEYIIGSDSYDESTENHHYNGDSLDAEKPGDSTVDDFFKHNGTPGSTTGATNGLAKASLMALPVNETNNAENDDLTNVEVNTDETTNFKLIGVKNTEISDGGETILNMSRANYSNAIYMDRLNKRLGEARYINSEEDEGMWVRIRHDRIGKDDAYRSQNTMYELGYDQKQECDNGERRVGFAIDYMHGDTGYNDIAGKGEIDRYGLWLYDTWMGDKGHYADYVAKWGHLSNDFEIYNSRGEVTGDYSNNVFSVSAEYGRKKDIGNDWYFEPQVQAQLARVTGADYTTNQGTKVSVDGINSLIGRAGFRLGKDFGEEKQSTVYIKADVLHEFLGDQDIRALDSTTNGNWQTVSYENEGTWYDVGFGFATQMSKNSYAFMDFEKSFGNDNDETYQINVGMQWSF